MKYCKKCFRNVREEVTGNICPYCGAPGLEEYGSQYSGEAFSCTRPKELERSIDNEIKALSPKKDKKEADPYTEEPFNPFGMFEEEKDAYGNVKNSQKACKDTEYDAYGSRAHDDKCDNAPAQPRPKQAKRQSYKPKPFSASAAAGSGSRAGTSSSPKTGFEGNIDDKKYTMRIEYLNMLKKIDGISKERIDELMRRYDETHSKETVKPSPKPYTAAKTYSSQSQGSLDSTLAFVGIAVAIFVCFIWSVTVPVAGPVFGIIIINSMRSKLKNVDERTANKAKKLINVFTGIFILLFFTSLSKIFGSAFIESMALGWGGLINV